MTSKKHTKRALLLSVLAMVLCLVMLMGSTFAWFTDSASTGVNKIEAGNLDVELQYATVQENNTLGEWKAVPTNESLFKDALWEPGHTQVVYLKVKNNGTLALKYKLGINEAGKVIGKTADDKDIDLAEFIEFGVVENASVYGTRKEARDAVTTSQTIASGYTKDGHLLKGEETGTLALVVYMPETVDNKANHGTGKQAPSISLGIELVATQDTVESDSFNNQYDKDAGYPVTSSSLSEMLEKGGNLTLTEDVKISERELINADNATLDMGGKTISAKNMDLIIQGRNVTIKNGTFSVLNGGSYGLFVGDEGETDNVVIENVTMYGGVNVYNASNVILRNCEIHGTDYYAVWADYDGEVIIESGTYYSDGVTTLRAYGGDDSGAHAGKIIVKGGSFQSDPTAFVDTALYDVTLNAETNMYDVTPKN